MLINKFFLSKEKINRKRKEQKRREWLKIIGVSIFILVMLKMIKNLKFYNILSGVLSLESGKKDVVKIEHRDLIFVTKKDDSDELIINEMIKINWKFIGRYGHGYIFENDGEELFVKKTGFLNMYNVYTIANKEYFYQKTSALI